MNIEIRISSALLLNHSCGPGGSTLTVLVPMREEAFEEFLALSAKGYADDNIRSGRWPGAGALERAAAELAESLPNGIHSG
jgi:hypothetical protein